MLELTVLADTVTSRNLYFMESYSEHLYKDTHYTRVSQ